MKQATLCFCVKDDKVLLGLKKRGFGEGKWNGYGGKVQDGETPLAAAMRELQEESTIVARPEELNHMANIKFFFGDKPIFECFVYLIKTWQGEPVETEEMKPQWFPIANLPFDSMWADDPYWLPMVLNGQKLTATAVFDDEGKEVKNFDWKPM